MFLTLLYVWYHAAVSDIYRVCVFFTLFLCCCLKADTDKIHDNDRNTIKQQIVGLMLKSPEQIQKQVSRFKFLNSFPSTSQLQLMFLFTIWNCSTIIELLSRIVMIIISMIILFDCLTVLGYKEFLRQHLYQCVSCLHHHVVYTWPYILFSLIYNSWVMLSA